MLALRIIAGLGLAYALLLLLAWVFQDRLAFPAPRANVPDPKRVGVENGEKVELVSGDGTKLVGWYLKPVEVGGGRGRLGEVDAVRSNLPHPPPTSPGLLWFYGNGETVAAIWPVVRAFQPPGTAVLVLDYPGYGGSGGRATEAALYAAAEAAYAALAARRPRSARVNRVPRAVSYSSTKARASSGEGISGTSRYHVVVKCGAACPTRHWTGQCAARPHSRSSPCGKLPPGQGNQRQATPPPQRGPSPRRTP